VCSETLEAVGTVELLKVGNKYWPVVKPDDPTVELVTQVVVPLDTISEDTLFGEVSRCI